MFLLILLISNILECQSRFQKPEAWFKVSKNKGKSVLSLRSDADNMPFIDFESIRDKSLVNKRPPGKHYEDACKTVCEDLPRNDNEPVCMMFSRYKKGFLAFINQCHARRAVCRENLLLHMVHPSRCLKSKQYFMTV